MSCQFLTNLFLCLKNIKAAFSGHFLGLISMRPLYAQINFFHLLIFILILLLIQPQEPKRGRGGNFPLLEKDEGLRYRRTISTWTEIMLLQCKLKPELLIMYGPNFLFTNHMILDNKHTTKRYLPMLLH